MKRYHVRSVLWVIIIALDARLCALLSATARSAKHSAHTHIRAPSRAQQYSGMHVSMLFVTCAFRGQSIVPGACAHRSLSYWDAFTRDRKFAVWVVSSCRKYTIVIRAKNKSQARYESWTHKYSSANYVMEWNRRYFFFETHRTISFLLIDFPHFFRLFSGWLFLLNWFVRTSLSALGCRQTYHIDMCPKVQKFFSFFLFFRICRCQCLAPLLFSLVYFAIKWARPVLGIYISRRMLRGNILLLCVRLQDRKTNDCARRCRCHKPALTPHTANPPQTNIQTSENTIDSSQ